MSKIDLSTNHPILDIQNHVVFGNNGNVVLYYRLELPEVYSLSETDFEELHAMWFQAFKSLPVGTVVHKQDVYQKKGYDAAGLPTDTFLSKATHDHFKGREYLLHQGYLCFVLPLDNELNAAKYVNPFRKLEKGLHRKLDRQVAEFMTAVDDVVSYINNYKGLVAVPMGSDEILAHTRAYFNGFNPDFDTDILFGNHPIEIGDHYFDLMAINSEGCFGESVQSSIPNGKFSSEGFSFHMGFLDGLGLELGENHIVNQILYMDDTQKWRKVLDKKIEGLAKSSNFGSQNQVVLEKVRHILDKINADDTSRIVRGHVNIIYWHQELGALKGIASKIKAPLKGLDIRPYHPNGGERTHYFLNSYPCHAPNFSNGDLFVMDLKAALCLYINNTNYRSDHSGILFNDRQYNVPVLKDVWDEGKTRIKARNFAIFAPTGEGKSFLGNNILRQFFEAGVRLVIIDLGGSYAKFAKLYPDDHVVLRYEQGRNLGINPFYMVDEADLTPERLEDLALFLLELLAEEQVAKSRHVALKKVLLHYYDRVREGHSLASLYSFVDRHKDTLIRDIRVQESDFNVYGFLHILSEYVDGGMYSTLFHAEEDQTYKIEDKRLIVFELDEVRDNKEILSVMLKLIKSAIQRTIWQNRSERGMVLFDEFAKQLKFPKVLESVEFYYQAIRKQNGAVGIVLQSINQLPENPAAASILENTQVIYSLRNEKGYADLRRRLNLSDHDIVQLRSIRNQLTGKRRYTEIFIKIGNESNVFRLEVPPEAHAAYLTDGAEHALIMEHYRQCGNMERAIKEFINQQKRTI
ncbi:TraG family conjugative transposon ATPase [Flagellimonas okinawensis]|uniref:TraG family conjugative transposon ATPase n=1 Tax=Flagellimonas okinawensis TaxID=3031324 RepID=A0ABT5XT35_9FLAO|nr:TraG family conjugative transposon ATPase [[Muricauda] okinawensis]MDF0709042.1 TraG family conjugative transposon ATPase [[Muricauda] okinawensis]